MLQNAGHAHEHRNFHLHGLDDGNSVTFGDVRALLHLPHGESAVEGGENGAWLLRKLAIVRVLRVRVSL